MRRGRAYDLKARVSKTGLPRIPRGALDGLHLLSPVRRFGVRVQLEPPGAIVKTGGSRSFRRLRAGRVPLWRLCRCAVRCPRLVFRRENAVLRRHVKRVRYEPADRDIVLIFIEHGTRRLHIAGVTPNPTGSWVAQQAPNLAMDLAISMDALRFLVRDRDTK